MPEQAPNPQPDVNTQSALPSGTDLGAIQAQTGSSTANARPGERNLELEATNREKMLASGELTAGMNQTLADQKVNLFTYGVENPTFGATVSSDGAREQFANDTKQLADDMKTTQAQMGNLRDLPTPEYQLYKDYTSQYEDLQQRSKDIYEQVVANIERDFEVREQEQRDVNRKITGQQTKNLARFGSVGRSASSMAFLRDVEVSNQQQLNKLMVQKGQVMIQAAEAAQARDLKLLGELVSHSQSLTNQFNEVQKWRLEDAIATNNQLITQNRFGWEIEDRYMNKMSQAIESGIELDDQAKRDFEKNAGLEEGMYDALKKVNDEAKEKEDKLADLDFQKQLIELQSSLPEGKTFKIGDEVYSGWKVQDDKTWKQLVTGSNGKVTVIKYDPKTEEFTQYDAGFIGQTSKPMEIDGALYEYDSEGNVVPIETKAGFANPYLEEGFDNWAATIGNTTQGWGGKTDFQSSHTGVDLAAPVGTPITAFKGGKVVGIDTVGAGGYGKYVVIEDANGKRYRYAHLNQVGVEMGQEITQGMSIAEMGNTGNISSSYTLDENGQVVKRTGGGARPINEAERAAGLGSHLHFEVINPGQPIRTDGGDGHDHGAENIPTEHQPYVNALANAQQGMPMNQREENTQTLQNYLDAGNLEGAQDFLIRIATRNSSSTQQTAALGNETAVRSLENIQTMLNDYVAKTGDTNIFNAKLEEAANIIGETTDPELAGIRSRIRASVQQYIRAMSGLAVTDAERQTYLELFPSIAKDPELNTASIDAVLDELKLNRQVMIEQYIGPQAYNQLFNAPEPITSIQSYVDANPQQYDAISQTMIDNNYSESQMVEFLNMLQQEGLSITDL